MTDLTEQWNKGELPEGDYYIKRRNGLLPYDNIDSRGVWRNSIDEDIIEVLAPVPSYEGFMTLVRAYDEVVDENTNLKTDCHTLAQKLLQVKPELREWLEVNYGEYL